MKRGGEGEGGEENHRGDGGSGGEEGVSCRDGGDGSEGDTTHSLQRVVSLKFELNY